MYPSRRPRLDVASVASEILVSIVRCLFRIAPLLLAGLFMAGCAPSHYSKGTPSFAAAAPALGKVDASYTAVNDVHIFEEQTELVAQYDTSGYRPGQIKALISPEELETRTQAVSVLRRYSQAIGDLAAGKQAQTALRSLSPAPVAPISHCRSGCERQDDPTTDGPHPVWTRRCAHLRPE
jgi:hypothetical protein